MPKGGIMKKVNYKIVLAIFLMMMMAAFMYAETLKMDNNGIPIQMSRYFTTERDTIPAQSPAAYDSLAVPSNAAETIIIGRHQPLLIKYGGAINGIGANWIYIPKDMPVKLPTLDAEYICYKSTTGAASINIIWVRM